MPTMDEHSLTIDQDDDGWDYGTCKCGWQSSPVPGADIVADAYTDHRLDAAGVDHTPNVVFGVIREADGG